MLGERKFISRILWWMHTIMLRRLIIIFFVSFRVCVICIQFWCIIDPQREYDVYACNIGTCIKCPFIEVCCQAAHRQICHDLCWLLLTGTPASLSSSHSVSLSHSNVVTLTFLNATTSVCKAILKCCYSWTCDYGGTNTSSEKALLSSLIWRRIETSLIWI